MKKLLLIAVSMAALLAPVLSRAESNVNTAAVTGSAVTARLNFSVVIPSVLYLAVGTNTTMAANTTVDNLLFTVPAASIGAGTTSVVTTGGDIGSGAVTVRVFSNVGGATGNVSLNSSTSGQMLNAAGDAIPWTDIAVAAAPLATATTGYTNTGITHPAFNNGAAGGAGTLVTLTAASKVVRQEGKWTFSYANTGAYPAGTYGGTVAKNGVVTYTATAL
ncbi:hypothetical protein ACFPOE_01360 [Caenimonas terrae]|uniref:WxL domain-containing protein n=1 Tax=Caenimonas terrae TaxID=696074 RepID=A0ABW0N9C8_9BURK